MTSSPEHESDTLARLETEALSRLAAHRDRPYYDAEADTVDRDAYYAGVDLGGPPDQHPPADPTQDVREFIEQQLLHTLEQNRRDAPSLKVVVAALINDPEMTADLEQRHDGAVEHIALALNRFREAGAISEEVDIASLASGIEQASFAIGFFLQLVFERPERELKAIAKALAEVIGQGLQSAAPQPFLDPRRRKAVAAVAEARQQLDNVLDLLEEPEPGAVPKKGGLRRSPA